MHGPAVRAAIVVFIASFCTLVLELVAGRMLSPYVGVSLYTWTSIIGVVLAGISGGAWAGGVLADRRPAASTLGWLLLASGVAALLIVPAATLFAADDGLLTSAGIAMTLMKRVVALAVLLFFVPSFLLGMISPVAVKLAVRSLDNAGRIVGRMSAMSTLGAIAGTFATGFYFVARFGTRATVIGVGAALLATAFLFGDLFRAWLRAVAMIALVAGCVYAARPPAAEPPYRNPQLATAKTGVIHTEESAYYTIGVERTVRDDSGAPLHALHLDHLVHSYSDLADPAYLEYGYLDLFLDVIEWGAIRKGPQLRLLFIGGGGYTLPRYLEKTYPSAQIDVVEIDPAVTRVAKRYFGLPRSTRIRTINEDARWFGMRKHEPYDVIIIDAFNDLSVPFHLTTREYSEHLRRMLKPGGTLAANVIDDYARGRFLASYAKTLQSVFGDANVAIVMEEKGDLELDRSTYVVMASSWAVKAEGEAHVVAGDALRRYVRRRNAVVLTDDYVPVDNMLAPLFVSRFVDEIHDK